MSDICPCLWFDTQAEEAARFYVDVFMACGKEAALTHVNHYSAGMPMPEGTVLTAAFTLAGQKMLALNGGPLFTHSPALSLMVACDDQQQVDAFWTRLSQGGQTGRCGWLTDRYGVSWQIVPEELQGLITQADPTRLAKLMQAVMPMDKLDIAILKAV